MLGQQYKLKPFLLSSQNLKCQRISVCKWEKHLPFDLEKYLAVRSNSNKTALQTCNLWKGQSLTSKFEFSTSNSKKNHICRCFCHFNFQHSRRNHVSFFLDCQKWSHAQRRLFSLNSSIENSAVINDSVLKLVL